MSSIVTFDMESEKPITLREAAGMIPSPRTTSKQIALVTLRRWITDGVKGPDGHPIRLQAVRIGNSLLTSREAVYRFAAATSGSPATLERPDEVLAEAAKVRLEAAGYK